MTLLNLVVVFFARHWLLAIANAALTAVLGLGLLRWARTWRALGYAPARFLRLRRFVLLAALYKGALYLLLGVSLQGSRHQPLIYGIQIPDPTELFFLVPSSSVSIWHPTAATELVSVLLLSAAFGLLGRRAVQFLRSKRGLDALLRLGNDPSDPRVSGLLRRAALALDLPARFTLPTVLLREVSHPTPMLIGVSRPYILLSPTLASLLSDAEIEMAFRHELAHLRQRDHWWRWLFTWLEDVGRLNLLSGRLGVLALDLEEQLCDRLSVRSPQEALVLANAIQKTVAFYRRPPPHDALPSGALGKQVPAASKARNGFAYSSGSMTEDAWSEESKNDAGGRGISLPDKVLPALLGRHTRKWSRPSSLHQRLHCLLALSQELSALCACGAASAGSHSLDNAAGRLPWYTLAGRGALRFALIFLLFLILYIKFNVAVTLVVLH